MVVIFYIAAIFAVIGALAMVLLKNPVHSGLSLVGSFFMLGVIYITINQEFVAAIQILIYAGAIMVLFLFLVMLLNLTKTKKEISFTPRTIFSIVFSIVMLFQLVSLFSGWDASKIKKGTFTLEVIEKQGTMDVIGTLLFSKYLLPFELISVLLLVAVIGAVVIAKKRLSK